MTAQLTGERRASIGRERRRSPKVSVSFTWACTSDERGRPTDVHPRGQHIQLAGALQHSPGFPRRGRGYARSAQAIRSTSVPGSSSISGSEREDSPTTRPSPS
jgi:hypothetical protein